MATTSDIAGRVVARARAGELPLPLLPQVAQELAAVREADYDARKLAERLKADASLAGNVLRIANSAAYGGAERIVSLQQAVARLGLRALREVVLVASLEAGVLRTGAYAKVARAGFRHSFAVALFAQAASRLRRQSVEESFVSGLLRDIARPVLLGAIETEARVQGAPTPSVEELDPLLRPEFAAIGASLGRRWNLSPRVVAAIEHRDAPAEAGANAWLAWTCDLSDALAMHVLSPEPAEPPRAHRSLSPLGLYPEDLELLLAQASTIRSMVEGLA